MAELNCKLLVIGAGPGGYVCAIRASQLGVDTIIVEKDKPGGTCLNVGCIPSKAIIHAGDEYHKMAHATEGSAIGITAAAPAIDFAQTLTWKDGIVGRLNGGVAGLLKKAKVRQVAGTARFHDAKKVIVDGPEGETIIKAENVVIATGSTSVELPFLPFDGTFVQSSTDVLADPVLPKKLAVVGGGYIGLELGTALAKLGVQVTVVEAAERILPQYDPELTKPVADRLGTLGVTVMTKTFAQGVGDDGKSLLVKDADDTETIIACDKVLVTVGRRPVTKELDLDRLAADMDGAFIKIDETCATSMRGLYAIGDVTGEPMLAHRAMSQGEMVAEIVAGEKRVWDKYCIPAVCFTDPEILTVGLSPTEAKDAAHDIKTGKFPFMANGRAMTTEREDGFIRVVARADNHQILGIQAVGEGISEMAAGFALAIEMGARLEDVAGTIHAHPTKGEALQEAALMGLGHALHI
ncbi:MAG: dihydrolipoyl dehydrogenase [Pseudomonadota bacterium]